MMGKWSDVGMYWRYTRNTSKHEREEKGEEEEIGLIGR